MRENEKLEFYMDLAEEFKNSWEEAEQDVDILVEENLKLKRIISDLTETITYYDVILKNFRKKLNTIINED